MVAPPEEAAELIEKWRRWQDVIDHQLHRSRLYRTVFTEIRDRLIEKDKLRGTPHEGGFILSYADVYWDSQVMAVRRLVDTHDGTYSMPNLIAAIRANRQAVPRSWFVALWLSLLPEPSNRDRHDADGAADEIYGGGCEVLSDEFFDRMSDNIVRVSGAVQEHATKHIAHRDRSYVLADSPVTLTVIHQALDDLERLASLLHLLLTGVNLVCETISFKSGWKLPLMEPLFEPPPYLRRLGLT